MKTTTVAYIILAYILTSIAQAETSNNSKDIENATVHIFHTYENAANTDGKEVLNDESDNVTIISDNIEFSFFPNGSITKSASYEIDIQPGTGKNGTMIWTLKSNTYANNKVLLNGEYYRHYVLFDRNIKSVHIARSDNMIVHANVYKYKDTSMVDAAHESLSFPDHITSNVIVLVMSAGSDLSNLEQKIAIDFEFGSTDGIEISTSLDVTVMNTFQGNVTNYEEAKYHIEKATISDVIEFPSFPHSLNGNNENISGFCDIDIEMDSYDPNDITIHWSFKKNTGFSSFIFDNYTFDRYYVTFDKQIQFAKIIRSDNLNVHVNIPAYRSLTHLSDPFETDIAISDHVTSNTLYLEIGPGTNLNNMEQEIIVEIFLEPIQFKPQKGEVILFNAYQDTNRTGGKLTAYQKDSSQITNEIEFVQFPRNPPEKLERGWFYDIDMEKDEDSMHGNITFTLKNNQNASNLVLQNGEYDRYYFFFEDTIKYASVVNNTSTEIHAYAGVRKFEKVSMTDMFDTGLAFPQNISTNVIHFSILPRSNLSTLEQVITIHYGFEDKNSSDDNVIHGDTDNEVSVINTYQGNVSEGKEMLISKNFYDNRLVYKPEFNAQKGGLYDFKMTLQTYYTYFGSIKYQGGSIRMTLRNNSHATNIVSEPGEYDRYYISFNMNVKYVNLYQSDNLAVNVWVSHFEETNNFANPMNISMKYPNHFASNVIVLEIGEGSDLSELNQNVIIEFGFENYTLFYDDDDFFFYDEYYDDDTLWGVAFLISLIPFVIAIYICCSPCLILLAAFFSCVDAISLFFETFLSLFSVSFDVLFS